MKQLKTFFVAALFFSFSVFSNVQWICSGVSSLEVLITNIFGVQRQGQGASSHKAVRFDFTQVISVAGPTVSEIYPPAGALKRASMSVS